MTTTLLERGTKPFIMVSVLAVAALTVTTATEWPMLRWVSLLALVGSFLAARWFPTAVVQGWLATTYLAPGLLAWALADFRLWDLTPWFAGLIGAMLATADPTRWHLPVRWRAPLVAWVLVVAASWPVVWLRELDFAPSVVAAADLVNNGAGGASPDIVHLWVYGVVLTHALGLLWLDWLCATFSGREAATFERVVLIPLGIGWVLATAVAAYQSVVDFGFINPGHWEVLRRASGTLWDANPFGMAAALWGGMGVAMVCRRWRPSSGRAPCAMTGLATVVLLAAWYGVWVSGSRSALLAGGIVSIVVLRQMLPLVVRATGGRVAVVGLVVALVLGGTLVATGSSVVGPWQRLARTLPTASFASVRAFGTEQLWDRNWYGTTAARMIADSPVVGVGVGSFRILVPDVAYQLGHGRLEPDNAQNWFRHQLAEFGVLGSLGWILWVAMFLRLLAVARPPPESAVPAGIVRGVVVALGIASLVGLPTQNTALALTFWTLVFWYVLLVKPEPRRSVPVGAGAVWAGVWVLTLVYVVGLGYVSWSDLRVPLRAQRADWDYSYGFYDAEPAGSDDAFRWASKRALAVLPVRDPWIELSAWTHHPDLQEDPVELKVWLDGELLVDSVRADGEPITRAVRIPDRQRRVLVETWVNRTWRPSDYGEADTRELGPGVRWRFFDP